MSLMPNRHYLRNPLIRWILKLAGYTIYHNHFTDIYIATKDSQWQRSRIDIILQQCKGLSDDELDVLIDHIHAIYTMHKEPYCDNPPEGWYCTRERGHDGPCAAYHKEQ